MVRAKGFQADPRTNRVAARLMADAMQDIAHRRVRHGTDFYAARSDVLHELAPAWVKVAGKDAADAAVRGLHMVSPDEMLTKAERVAVRDREQADMIALHEAARGRRLGWFNRLCVWLFGMPFLCVLAVAGGLLAHPGGAVAKEASSRWRALAECGVAKGADYERKCRRFSRTERSTWREYDGPGAGAPREWEMPKAWE